MNIEKIFETIDYLEQEYILFWQELCNIESPTEYKDGVDRAGRLIIERAKKLGFDIEICEQKISGNAFCITMNSTASARPVCFSGHIDTVHPVGAFGHPPVKIKDGVMYGPGVTDCKGGVVAALYAMNALKLCDFNERPIKLIVQSDEETGSQSSKGETIKFMAEKAKDCVAFLNCEGARDGGIILIRKGIIRCNFCVKGKSVHASAAHRGKSAIAEAAYKILELEKFKDQEGITASCGIINGGTAANTVPDSCSFTFDFRFQNKEQYAIIKKAIKHISDKSFIQGTSCEFKIISERVAMEEKKLNIELYEKIGDIFEKAGLQRLGRTLSAGGSDASDMTSFGIPTVDGFGVYGCEIHSVNEKADISSLLTAAKRLALIAVEIE